MSYAASDNTQLALAYEFRTALGDLKGRGGLTTIDTDNNQIVLSGAGRLENLQFPQAWIVGVSHRVWPALAVVADLRHTLWSQSLGDTEIAFTADDGGDLKGSLPTGFRDLTTLALGVEWQFQPNWTGRVGGSHAFQQVVPDQNLNGTLPTITRQHLTGGVAWRPAPAHELSLGVSVGLNDPVRSLGGTANSIPAIEARNRQVNSVLSCRYLLL